MLGGKKRLESLETQIDLYRLRMNDYEKRLNIAEKHINDLAMKLSQKDLGVNHGTKIEDIALCNEKKFYNEDGLLDYQSFKKRRMLNGGNYNERDL